MLPAKKKREKMGCRVQTRVRSDGHLKWVRNFSCAAFALSDHVCRPRIEAHHVHEDGEGGIGIKPGDNMAVSLCSDAHRELHLYGETAFQAKYKINLVTMAANFWKASPHRKKWEDEHG